MKLGGGVPICATREVDELAAWAVKPGPKTIWLPAISVTLAPLLSVVALQFAWETGVLQLVRVPAE